jgi:purine-binding chemotaxis protein CheW
MISKTLNTIVVFSLDQQRYALAGVQALTERQLVDAKQALPFAEYVKGVAKLEDGLVLIHDLDTFLSLDEGRVLDAALAKGSK